MSTVTLRSLNVSKARPLQVNGRAVMSGIGKRGVDGPLDVALLGIAGDEQADPSVHGGLSKAVYAYPGEHYGFWQTVRAQARVSLWDEVHPPGFMGENLTLAGLLETQVFVGDVLQFPDCALAVSEPRYPCSKFNAVMGFNQASKMMAQSGWSGFYLSVRRPGLLRAGDVGTLVEGPREVGITELFRATMKRSRKD